ncbi:SIS domain-containing protein [uncultured Dysosmobacter sp.]|uniref:D-sedoheptulose-7-phosphate isomerase n=1 Tax=uncultured Dysosmobacter sp. TaxID=2591384 RepID=UPI00262736F1|nr:SIS domain-containing protein [uncultured Dysosmobacter sp.]
MQVQDKIKKELKDSIAAKEALVRDPVALQTISNIAESMVGALREGGKILICGNGGSASDALHISGEIVGRFQKERKAYSAIALNADVATMTAIANDYGYGSVFSRQVEGLATDKDILIGISTSGNSDNIIRAFKKMHEIGGKTVLFSGRDGGKLKTMADLALVVPCDVTAHIQEAHECVYHILCGLVEDMLS